MLVPRKKPSKYPLLPSTCLCGCLGMWSLSRIKVTLQGEKKRVRAGLPLSSSRSVYLELSGPKQLFFNQRCITSFNKPTYPMFYLSRHLPGMQPSFLLLPKAIFTPPPPTPAWNTYIYRHSWFMLEVEHLSRKRNICRLLLKKIR